MNLISSFYPNIEHKKNYYGLFCPPIDRFILVDNTDPLMLFEVAKILSSKVNTVVYILDDTNVVDFTKDNCIEYSIESKKGEYYVGGAYAGSVKQTASMVITSSPVIKVGKLETKLDLIESLQTYSRFVLKCVQSIVLANALRNIFSEAEYLEIFFNKEFPASFIEKSDTTISKKGMLNEIKSILYFSNDKEEAIEKINRAWIDNSYKDVSGFREAFYNMIEIKSEFSVKDMITHVSEKNSMRIL
jgi:hypothetical protein